VGLAPRFSVYVISFLICTVAWVSHHELIHDVDCVDSRLFWLNNLYLMWIAFLPFPTGLLGRHPAQPVAVALYGAVCADYVPLFFCAPLVRLVPRLSHEEGDR
jgi:uncharacterized membrane protein